MDDVVVFGKDQPEHDARLQEVLERIERAGATLNPDKCEISTNSVKFLGHVIDNEGITADPDKTKALHQMEKPTTVSELRRFLGVANQLGKFSTNLAQLTLPLREVLGKRNAWVWGQPQQNAFEKSKQNSLHPQLWHCVIPQQSQRFLLMPQHAGSPATTVQRRMETCRICLSVIVRSRMLLCSN